MMAAAPGKPGGCVAGRRPGAAGELVMLCVGSQVPVLRASRQVTYAKYLSLAASIDSMISSVTLRISLMISL